MTLLIFLKATINAISNEFPVLGIPRVNLGATIEPISTARPDFLQGAATGGIFSGGFLRVGERGEEIIGTPASRVAVFPNKVTNMLTNLTNVLAQPQLQPVYGTNGVSNSYNQSNEYNDSMLNQFYGMNNNQDMMQRLAIQRMRKRR